VLQGMNIETANIGAGTLFSRRCEVPVTGRPR